MKKEKKHLQYEKPRLEHFDLIGDGAPACPGPGSSAGVCSADGAGATSSCTATGVGGA
jgi:hypothetical protein